MNATNIIEFSNICREPKNVILFFQSRNVISKNVFCENCKRAFSLIKRTSSLAGYEWRCSGCSKKQSVLKNSFMSNIHISPAKFLLLCFYWATEVPQRCVIEHLDLSQHTVLDFFQFFRHVCSWKLLKEPVQLGGMGRVVEISESVMIKAKYNRGRKEKWVFAAFDDESELGFITFVEQKDGETLLPIIEKAILPYTTIVSDEREIYQNITSSKNSYIHEIVNHKNFVNPEAASNTNVTNYWKRVKGMFQRMNGTYSDIVPSYLDEFMWRERYSKGKGEAFNHLLLHMSQMNPC